MPDRRRDSASERRNTMRMLTLITQFGINMIVPIVMCFFVGMWLDKKCGTNFIMIIGFFIGSIAGFRNVYLFSMKNIKNKNDSSEKAADEGKDERP